jgi:hypothetical protein
MTNSDKNDAKAAAVGSKGEGEALPETPTEGEIADAQAKSAGDTDPGLDRIAAPTVAHAASVANASGGTQDEIAEKVKGDPFVDTAPPVGAAGDAVLKAHEATDEDKSIDFDDAAVPFVAYHGDAQVSVRKLNNRNIVEVTTFGWVGPGQVFAPYQVSGLIAALQEVEGKLRKE